MEEGEKKKDEQAMRVEVRYLRWPAHPTLATASVERMLFLKGLFELGMRVASGVTYL